MVTYTATRASAGLIVDSKHVPNDIANRDWQAKVDAQAAGPISVGPQLVLELAAAKLAAKMDVNAALEARMVGLVPPGEAAQSHWILRHAEAVACDADGSPDPADYPLLAAEVDETGANVGAVADAVLAEVAAVKAAWVPLIEIAAAAKHAVDSCANQAAIDAVLAAITWPT